MNLKSLIDLKVNSVLRSPHIFQKFLLVFASLFYLFTASAMLLVFGTKMGMVIEMTRLSVNGSLSLYFTGVLLLAVIDFLLKVLLLKNHFQFAKLNYLPNASRALKQYFYIKQLTSITLFYIPFFLIFPVVSLVAPEYGKFTALMCIVFAYSISLFNSQLVSFLKQRGTSKSLLVLIGLLACGGVYGLLYYSLIPFHTTLLNILPIICFAASFFLLPVNYDMICYGLDQKREGTDLLLNRVAFGKSRIQFYVVLFLKMTTRSPLLRKHILMMTAFSFMYIFMIKPAKDLDSGMFILEVLWPLIIFTFVPTSVNQTIFRAEGAFFDQLYMMSDVQNLLKARYVVGVLYSIVMVVFFYGLYYIRFGNVPDWRLVVPTWLFSVGPYLLLSFLSIFTIGPKLDLYDSSWTNSNQNNNKMQALFILFLVSLMFGFCYIIFALVSRSAALWSMGVIGGVCILFSFKYLDFIFKIYHTHRYKKMESYRMN